MVPKRKFKTQHAFGARRRSMNAVRMAKLAKRVAGDCGDASCSAASATPLEEVCVATSSAVPSESAMQGDGVSSVPVVLTASTSAIAAPSLASVAVSKDASSTVRVKTHFLTPEEIEAAEAQRNAVKNKLGATPATLRKFQAMSPDPAPATATTVDEVFCLVQMCVFGHLLSKTLCQRCLSTGLTIQQGTQFGLATKLELVCPHCGIIANSWSSPRQNTGNAFEVNIRAIMAMKQIGKGQTAVNDFWAAMNVSHRGLHHKTYQEHLKKTFRGPETQRMESFYSESAAAVKKIYQGMDPGFTRDITVVYDGTWHKCGHTSHIGVGAVIEYHTGLILDAVVLSNQCLGCQTGPKPEDSEYSSWREQHICQRNTDAKSGRMEVEAALILFARSLTKHNLRYTTIVSDGDSATYSALVKENVYGLVPVVKEECLNHVQKRMGAALRNLVQKSDKALGGKGRLTKALIDKLTDYYGWALRNNSNDAAAMQRAVMASYHHITSTDEEPHHDLCPEGAGSWCRHKAAEANGLPQPRHRYNLPGYVAEAMLPVYKRLSEPSLLQRCLGAKTQNASESFHSVLWSLMPKEQHASLIAVETALNDAVMRYNAGNQRATKEISLSAGLTPGHLAIHRAVEKDALRMGKAEKRGQAKTERRQRKKACKDTANYSAGSF
ncbi:uncharacterized protein [Dermacentor albipictus]|uniref:uncharacterized protein n=1 Tax=Dermacentor albipictus TaxID=60249 RepID=UPI0038FD11A8